MLLTVLHFNYKQWCNCAMSRTSVCGTHSSEGNHDKISADTVISEQTAALPTSPPRKRACLLFAHYGTRPAVRGKPVHVCLVKVLFAIQVA